MKKLVLAAALAAVASTPALAKGHAKGEGMMEPVVVVEEAAASSSSAGIIIPLVLIALLAAAASD